MRTFGIIFLVIVFIIVVGVIYFFNSPRPAAWIVQQLFKTSPAVAPANYDDIVQNVNIERDIVYPSAGKNNTLDIISPKSRIEPLPTIIWVHGGAFVGGDKRDVEQYAVQIAANGYNVVLMNYALAPAAKYPSPLHQVADVYRFVESSVWQHGFDLNNLYFAGDSAGAQIAAQFATIQTNTSYAAQLEFEQTVPQRRIRGMLLYCGPYNIQYLSHLSDNKLVAFLLKRVGWAYIGERQWVTSEKAKLASPVDYLTKDFPPTFLTDGKFMSFEQHGIELAQRLDELDVPVTTKFYPTNLPHEYQFIMNTPEAEETLQATLDFLAVTKNALKMTEPQ